MSGHRGLAACNMAGLQPGARHCGQQQLLQQPSSHQPGVPGEGHGVLGPDQESLTRGGREQRDREGAGGSEETLGQRSPQ